MQTIDALQLLLLGSLLGAAAFSIAVLLLNASAPGKSLATLVCGLFALIALSEAADFLGWYGENVALDVAMIPAVRAMTFLFAPSFYLYACACLRIEPALPTIWHGVPALLCWCIFLLVEFAQSEGEGVVIAFWIAFSVHASIYLALFFRILLGRVQTLKGFFSNLPAGSTSRLLRLWLILFIPVVTILLELALVRIVPITETTQVFTGAFRIAAVLAALCLLVTDQLQPAEPDKPDLSKPYEKSMLSNEDAQRMAARLRAVMQEDALFRDPLLNLTGLSRRARIPEHTISQVLNQHLGLSFYDFINHYRVDAAKPLLLQQRTTVLDVALEVGFNSKSTFYAAFRKSTGQTPTEFRQENAMKLA